MDKKPQQPQPPSEPDGENPRAGGRDQRTIRRLTSETRAALRRRPRTAGHTSGPRTAMKGIGNSAATVTLRGLRHEARRLTSRGRGDVGSS